MSRRGIRVIPPLHPPHPGPRAPARVAGPARASACRAAGERDLRRNAGTSCGADGRPARAAARVRQCCCVRVRPVWRAGETGPGNGLGVGVAAAQPEPGQSRAATRLERGVAGPSSGRVALEQGTALGRNGRAVRRRRGEQGPRQGRGGAGFTITEGVC